MEAGRADVPRPHRASRDARSARRQDAARRGAHRSPRPDGVPLDRSRPHVEGSERSRRRSRPTAGASSTTRSGSRRATRRSRACGTPARRRRVSSAPRTAARRGRASTASTSIRSARRGAAATRTARRTARSCTRSSSTRATRSTCTSRMSSGGVFESIDAGGDWKPLNQGVRADSCPIPTPEYGHDPHCVRLAAGNPDRLYQQNHCGIYRLDRPGDALGAHRRRHAEGGRRHRLPDRRRIRAMPTRRGCSRWTAPTSGRALAGRQAGGVPHARRRQDVAAAGRRLADVAGVVDGQAPGDDGGRADPPACTSARRPARSGAAATRGAPGAASRAPARRSTPSRRRSRVLVR